MPEKTKSEDTPKESEIKYSSPEVKRGTYANFLIVQFTPFEFQLNFAYAIPPLQSANEEVETEIVAKINIPVNLMPSVIRALDESFQKFRVKMTEAQKESEKANE